MPLHSIDRPDAARLTFGEIGIADLDRLPPDVIDSLPYGVLGLTPDGIAAVYNETEARQAGINPATVLGVHFFSEVGQCMNNFLVAQRFLDEDEIDTVIDYVLTLRMRPTPVRLRLLKTPAVLRRYVLIERRAEAAP